MKIDPANVALVCVSVLAWTVAGAIVTSEPFGGKGVALAVGIGVATAFCASVRAGVAKVVDRIDVNAARMERMADAHACRMERVTGAHADHMERVTLRHADVLAQHGLTLEKVFGMGQRSDELARMLARETGPFRIVNGDG